MATLASSARRSIVPSLGRAPACNTTAGEAAAVTGGRRAATASVNAPSATTAARARFAASAEERIPCIAAARVARLGKATRTRKREQAPALQNCPRPGDRPRTVVFYQMSRAAGKRHGQCYPSRIPYG